MTNAAAVRIYRPSPRGFGGIGETGNVILGWGGDVELGEGETTLAEGDGVSLDMVRVG